MGKGQAGTRKERIGSQIREVIAQVLLFEVKDPTLRMVNVTDVEMTGDLGLAKVYYYCHGANDQQRARLSQALERGKGFLRRRIGQEIHARVTPELSFYYDNAIERGAHLESVIQQARAQDEALARELGSPSDDEDDDSSSEGSSSEASLDDDSSWDDSSWGANED